MIADLRQQCRQSSRKVTDLWSRTPRNTGLMKKLNDKILSPKIWIYTCSPKLQFHIARTCSDLDPPITPSSFTYKKKTHLQTSANTLSLQKLQLIFNSHCSQEDPILPPATLGFSVAQTCRIHRPEKSIPRRSLKESKSLQKEKLELKLMRVLAVGQSELGLEVGFHVLVQSLDEGGVDGSLISLLAGVQSRLLVLLQKLLGGWGIVCCYRRTASSKCCRLSDSETSSTLMHSCYATTYDKCTH